MKNVQVNIDYFKFGQLEMIVSCFYFHSFVIQSFKKYIFLNFKKDLLNEYLMWIPESLHFEVRLKWPPIE